MEMVEDHLNAVGRPEQSKLPTGPAGLNLDVLDILHKENDTVAKIQDMDKQTHAEWQAAIQAWVNQANKEYKRRY